MTGSEASLVHKSIKYLYAVMALFTVAMAFLVMQILDEAAVADVSTIVRIDESENTASGGQAVLMLEQFATDHGVNIGRELADLQHPDKARHLYLAVGDPAAASTGWLARGYSGFSRGISTDVHPLRDIGNRDPRGDYYLFGSGDLGDELLSGFSQLGLHGRQVPASAPVRALSVLGHGTLVVCLVIMALVVVAAVGSGVILNTRFYGIHRLHGHSFGHVLVRDLADVARFVLRTALIVVPAVALALFAYNRFSQIAGFTLIAAVIFAAFAALALIVHVLALAVVYRATILGSLKGDVPASWTMGGSYLIRIPALVVTLTAAVSLLVGAQQVSDQRSEMSTWAATPNAAHVLLNGSLGRDTSTLENSGGGWIRSSAELGQVIMSRQEPRGASPLSPASGPERDVLIVNSTYLDEQSVLDSEGGRHTGPSLSEEVVHVLIPEKYWNARDAITASVQEWATLSIGSRPVSSPRIQATTLANGQSLFTYNISVPLGRSPRLHDPVVVVIPAGSRILSDVDYAAYATQNGIVFRDAEYVSGSLARARLSEYLLAVNPAAENAANQYRSAARELRLRAFNLAVTLVLLVVTALSVAMIYGRRNSQSLFAKYLCGWSFVKVGH